MNNMYIAVLDEFPDYMVPTLVAHSVIGAHRQFANSDSPIYDAYMNWLDYSCKTVVVRVSQTEFDRIAALPNVHLGHESDGKRSCVVVCPASDGSRPDVLQFARLWKPKE